MNHNIVYLIRTVRYCGGFRVRHMRTYMLGTYKYKSAVQSTNLKKVLVNIPPSWLEFRLQFLPQETRDFSTEVADVSEQRDGKTELHEQSSMNALNVIQESAGDERNLQMKGRSQFQLFTYALETCKTPCDVLDLLAKFDYSSKVVTSSFCAMWRLIKNMPADSKPSERQVIFEHPTFALASQYLLEHSADAWGKDLVYSLHSAFSLGVPQNSLLIQTLLRVCQERLNEFSDKCLLCLVCTLKKMEKSKNVDALQLGLQMVVKQRMPEISDINLLQSMMKHFGKDAQLSLKKQFENRILKEMHSLTSENVRSIFNTLGAMNYTSIPILDGCSKKIVATLPGTEFWDFNHILNTCYILRYYNVEMFSAIESYVTSFINLWSIKQLVMLLSVFEILRFRPTKLLDIMAEMVINHPESLDLKDLLIILRVYSQLNYVPKGQDQQFFEALNCSLSSYLLTICNVDLLKAVFSFCILGYLPQAALNHLMQKDVLSDLLKPGGANLKHIERMLHTVRVCLKVDKHSFSKPASMLQQKSSFPVVLTSTEVREVLQTILQDTRKFRHNVQLEHGYYAHFEIKMDAERKKILPITEAHNSANLSVQRVVFLCASRYSFCLDMCPRGTLAVKMRHLKALGYRVIPIYCPKFQELGKEEASPNKQSTGTT
uniref:FAST kinase domains 2 n=1 Tax=Crocodylus porosus TaxID=8502 RepID=A0A7M4E0U2_CROPO